MFGRYEAIIPSTINAKSRSRLRFGTISVGFYKITGKDRYGDEYIIRHFRPSINVSLAVAAGNKIVNDQTMLSKTAKLPLQLLNKTLNRSTNIT